MENLIPFGKVGVADKQIHFLIKTNVKSAMLQRKKKQKTNTNVH